MHDAVLRSVLAAMEEGTPLRTWLSSQIPGPLDIELGYAFVRIADGVQVVRMLDLRGLTDANRRIFENAAQRAEPVADPYAPVGYVTNALECFREMLKRCERGEPPLELSDWRCEAPPIEGKIGPGWEDNELKSPSLYGFLLLPPSPIPGYQGIDRNPFEPSLIRDEMSQSYGPEGSAIWPFYPPGWRRDAYRLYEENLVNDGTPNPFLLLSREVAHKVQKIIEPHIGPHEIVACEFWELDSLPSDEVESEATFLGYDIAYPGGDYYSAIYNGLFVNPHPELLAHYRSLLNQFGLFSNTKPILAYVRHFRELVLSEADSEFCIYRLGLA
jgi:hypothetical protein